MLASARARSVHSLACLSTAAHQCGPLSTYLRCFSSSESAGTRADSKPEYMQFPGGKVPFSVAMTIAQPPATPSQKLPCYRTMNEIGEPIAEASVPHPFSQQLARDIFKCMVRLQTMDTFFYEAQRQGRFSFYMTSFGEEATIVASAAALDSADPVFTQYREQGVFMWRGFTIDDMANQCFGNVADSGKGRQMPVHYGSAAHHLPVISSPLATQLPHAVGAAYALKLLGRQNVAAAYFGDGAASEGDFHAAVNFAATLDCPTIFVCRNNGYAISTPVTEQYRGDGIACRGPSYGIKSLRVDGGDAQAVHNATLAARKMALETNSPVLLECMSYRVGHHSTSDDSSRYRTAGEMQQWKARDPVLRLQHWLAQHGWLNDSEAQAMRKDARKEVVQALEDAEKLAKPALSTLFDDVYDTLPWHLAEQKQAAFDTARMHPELVPQSSKLE